MPPSLDACRLRFPATPAWLAGAGHRALHLVVLLAAVAIVNFLLLQLAPGDAAEAIAGAAGSASPEYLAALRAQFGLDRPVASQLWSYLGRLATLDLGYSFRHGMPVAELIVQRLPATLLLVGASVAIAAVAGSALGVLAASHAGRPTDAFVSALALLFFATPLFWIGLMLIVVFSVLLEWLPVGGMVDVAAGHRGWRYVADVATHLVLPAVTLGLFYMAGYIRLVRATMIQVSRQDFVRTAIAKGAGPGRVLWRHTLRNALLPVVTLIGVQAGSVLGGAVLVETVFSWPGLGRLAFEALYQRDLNLLLGILLCSAATVVVVNWVVDAVYARLDPRIRVH